MRMPVPMPLTRLCEGVMPKASSAACPRTVRSLWMLTTADLTRSTTSTMGVRRGLNGPAARREHGVRARIAQSTTTERQMRCKLMLSPTQVERHEPGFRAEGGFVDGPQLEDDS